MKLKLSRIALKRKSHDKIHCSQLPKELVWIPEILQTEDVALIVQCMTWRVNFVRSKDAQKQLVQQRCVEKYAQTGAGINICKNDNYIS